MEVVSEVKKGNVAGGWGGGGVGGGGFFFFFKQKTAYEMCGRDWSSDVCSSDLTENLLLLGSGRTSSSCVSLLAGRCSLSVGDDG